jgi:hypothetical protein
MTVAADARHSSIATLFSEVRALGFGEMEFEPAQAASCFDAPAFELTDRLEQQIRGDREQVTHVRGVQVVPVLVSRSPGLMEEEERTVDVGAVEVVVQATRLAAGWLEHRQEGRAEWRLVTGSGSEDGYDRQGRRIHVTSSARVWT